MTHEEAQQLINTHQIAADDAVTLLKIFAERGGPSNYLRVVGPRVAILVEASIGAYRSAVCK